MAEYPYSISTNFPSGVQTSYLGRLVTDNIIITTTLNDIGTLGDVLTFYFAATLSGPEETELNNIVNGYTNPISANSPPGFFAFKNGDQGSIGTSVTNIIGWTINYETNDFTNFNVTTGVYTIPQDGVYQIAAEITFTHTRNTSFRLFQIYNITTAAVIFSKEVQPSSTNVAYHSITIGGNVHLTQGIEIVCRAKTTGGTATMTIKQDTSTSINATTFGVFLLG